MLQPTSTSAISMESISKAVPESKPLSKTTFEIRSGFSSTDSCGYRRNQQLYNSFPNPCNNSGYPPHQLNVQCLPALSPELFSLIQYRFYHSGDFRCFNHRDLHSSVPLLIRYDPARSMAATFEFKVIFHSVCRNQCVDDPIHVTTQEVMGFQLINRSINTGFLCLN